VKPLRFGIIGLSDGNGHPYSWAAIFNGYDPAAMATCPFPVIPAYLAERSFPADAIAGAAVTHVWTQDAAVSAHVAAAARIPTAVTDFADMIGHVDGVLLARDDAETHYYYAAPFLRAGVPVFIDKPLALSVLDAELIYSVQDRQGLVFSCSALKYAAEFLPTAERLAELGTVKYITGTTPKKWDTYAVHVLDPLQRFVRAAGRVTHTAATGGQTRHLEIRWESGLEARVTALGDLAGPLAITLHGDRGWLEMRFQDSFTAFRSSLQHFTDIVRGDAPPQDPAEVMAVVELIEAGRTA